jgi:SulP family sulfate permease
VTHSSNLRADLRGGLESSLQGFATTLGPILLFVGVLGGASVAAAFWAVLVTATVVPAMHLLLGGRAAILPSTRAASLTAYAALVLQLAGAVAAPAGGATLLSAPQLLTGLAAASLMFFAASSLVLLAGLLKLGNIFKMIPSTVAIGIGNSTALLLVWLALKQISHGSWTAALTAAVMVACIGFWPGAQARSRALRPLPAIAVALLAGLAISLLVEPAMAATSSTASTYDASWIAAPLWPSLLQQASPGRLLLLGLPGTVTLALVMILESFTANHVMETRFGVRTNANRQLLVLGGANLASALLGGVPCTSSPVRSVANWTAGGRGAPAAIASLVLTGLALLALGHWLLALPAGVVAGLFLLQVPLLVDRAFAKRLSEMMRTRHWRRTGSADLGFWITVVISLLGFFGSLIWACFLGIGLSCLAVLRRVSHTLTAQWAYLDRYRSRRVRSAGETGTLAHACHRVGILRLTGHLFFGNSARLALLADELHPDAVAVAIDVSQVRDVDPSGLTALGWLVHALGERRLTVVLSGLKRTASTELRQTLQALPEVHYCVDLDRGLEACEDLILMNATVQASALLSVPLEKNSLLQDLSDDEVTDVLMLGERRDVARGSALFYKDAVANGVWLLDEGVVSILSGSDGASSRLATFGPGQFVGEMGYIDGKTRSATAWADTPVRGLLLDQAAITALVERQPATALKITRNIARELSHRVRSASALLSDASADAAADWDNSALSRF